MCDYSLRALRTRTAEEGEELVLYSFGIGVLGFVARADLLEIENEALNGAAAGRRGVWHCMKEWFLPRTAGGICAVSMPPGSRLFLSEIPEKVQKSLSIGPFELVIFEEVNSRSYAWRDALLLGNGTRVLLQDLPEGIHATMLSFPTEPVHAPVENELLVA